VGPPQDPATAGLDRAGGACTLTGMRVLITTTGFPGHFLPLVPFAQAFREAGHSVYVAGPRASRPIVARAGLGFVPCADLPADEIAALLAAAGAMRREDGHAHVVKEGFAGIAARTLAPKMERIAATWRPDLVLHESQEFAGAAAAERHGIRHARVALGLSSTEQETLALAGAEPSPLLTLVPPAFDDGDAPTTWRFRERRTVPVRKDDGEPLVYVTFGSVAPTLGYFPGLYRAVIDALADVSARVMVTTAAGDVGPVPPNVSVVPWLPQDAVLEGAAAVVSHGGYGTLLGALAHGLPQVVMPLFAQDQWRNAQRVAELGAGVALEGRARDTFALPGPDVLAALPGAVEHVLLRDRYARATGELAADIASLPPVADAVPALNPEVPA
jgi:UDP:flavonoid glycosyltransferase YjiC (YdhE family)